MDEPRAGAWTRTGERSRPRTQATLTTLADGRALIAGEDEVAELYDPATRTCSGEGRLAAARTHHKLRVGSWPYVRAASP